MFIIKAFASGIMFFANMFVNSWWWILGLVVIIALMVLESKEVENEFEDDGRQVL